MVKGKFNFKELERYKKKLERMAKHGNEWSEFIELCSKELATRLLALVIPRTPVGENVTYLDANGKTKVMKNGGTLRRGWTARSEKEAESGNTMSAKAYAESLEITRQRKYIHNRNS